MRQNIGIMLQLALFFFADKALSLTFYVVIGCSSKRLKFKQKINFMLDYVPTR